MIEMNFENFINEKLGIKEDVTILSDFLYDYLKDIKNENKIIIDGTILPSVSFKISKMIIEFKDYHKIASFDEKYSKLTKDGVEIYLLFNKNEKLVKSIIKHEISHVIDFEIKLSKRVEIFKDKINSFNTSNIISNLRFKIKFDNLCKLIYYSDDGEIKALTHEFHDILDKIYNKHKNINDKNFLFDIIIKNSDVKNIYEEMINYNIFEDLKDISDKIKLKFFNDIINIEKKLYKIKKNKNNKLLIIIKIILFILRGYEKNIDLQGFMYKTQKHINMRGIKLRNNIHRLYGLL